jgi:uncharacterized protein
VRVSALRRYPVKSMGGESPPTVVVDERGMQGDRWYAVTDGEGRLACGKNSRRFRRRDAVFAWAARTVDDGVVVRGPAGEWAVGDPALDLALSDAMGEEVRVLAETDAAFGHQDGGQVSLVGTASLAWCRDVLRVDADPRRLRVNVVVETDEPFEEESWIGAGLCIGGVVLRPVEQVERCRTIDLAQDGVPTTTPWLKALGSSRELCLGIYADVVTPGVLSVGDVVSRATTPAPASRRL